MKFANDAIRELIYCTRGYKNYVGNCEKYVIQDVSNFINSVVYFNTPINADAAQTETQGVQLRLEFLIRLEVLT
jgi:hypothetical protein